MRNLITYIGWSFFCWLILPQTTNANNLSITNTTLDQANQTITFNLSWNNSWRFDGLADPQNWDAAWVFVKFRTCTDCNLNLKWTHGTIDGPGSTFGALEAHSTDAGGQYYTDSLGIMLRRSATGLFPNEAAASITLMVENMPTTGPLEVRVLGVEMVYIPEAAFELGDGGNTTSRFHAGTSNTTPYNVTSENPITVVNTAGNLYAVGGRPPDNSIIPATFPKGFGAFYVMKYEISQEQYATFLNTIGAANQAARFPGNYGTDRNRLNNVGTIPAIYASDRPDRAQNYLSTNDLFSYLDWAALRPITEMEYEKAARGTLPALANEYAWGTTTISQARNITPSAAEDGTESISSLLDANARYGSFGLTGGDFSVTANFNDQRGPVRVGAFADPFDNSRVTTGASYYGVMELSGNISEITISMVDVQAAPIFDGTYGDGCLSASGLHDASSWPQDSNPETNIYYRGGDWNDFSTTNLRISYRGIQTNNLNLRGSDVGGRGGR